MTRNFDSSLSSQVADAFETFGSTRTLSEPNEATTRCELIDRILTAMGWPAGSFSREVSTGTGDFVDYELPRKPPAAMVVEAKRAGATFALDPDSLERGACTRALSTLRAHGGTSFRDALKQVAGYCNDRGIPYACITNGYQWIFFRGLSSDAQRWIDGRAVVFPSAGSVLSNLDTFRACIDQTNIRSSQLARLLSHPTRAELPAPRRPVDYLTFRGLKPPNSRLSERLDISRQLFADIHGGDKSAMLDNCYVEPGVLPDFDNSLRRLLADTLAAAAGVERTEEGGASAFVNRIHEIDYRGALQSPMLVVGNVGVGKTTFLHKTLAMLRARPVERASQSALSDQPTFDDGQAIFAYVDLENHGTGNQVDERQVQSDTAGLIIQRLARTAEAVLKKRPDMSDGARAEADPDRDVTLRTMLRKELKRERSLGRAYFDANPSEWLKREYELFRVHRDECIGFLIHYIRHLRARFMRSDGLKYPILLILDNLDQASPEYQKSIYGLGLRLAKDTPAVVIVSMREDTFHQAREPRGFLSSAALEFVFHVSAPALDQLLKQRVRYARWAQANAALPRPIRGISNEVSQVLDLVTTGLLAAPVAGLEVIAALAGHDTRAALRLVRELIVGATRVERAPESTVDFMLECLLASRDGTELPRGLANVFDTSPYLPPLHALRCRLLGYFGWAYEQHPERGIHEATDFAIWRFSSWGYEPECIEAEMTALLSQGLLGDGGAASASVGTLPARMCITATGHAHIARLVSEGPYRAVEALFTRWYEPGIVDEFIRQAAGAGSKAGTSLGDIVAARTVRLFDAYLAASIARENGTLSRTLENQTWVRESLSRSALVAVTGELSRAEGKTRTDNCRQLDLIKREDRILPRLPASMKLAGTVWLPRILWALEYARVNGMGPLTAAGIARVLTNHGDVDVPDTNVARAFRVFRGRDDVQVYFNRHGKRYSISSQGTRMITSIIQVEHA